MVRSIPCVLEFALLACVPASTLVGAQGSSGPRLEARVDPRVELFSILFRLAGNREYNSPASASPYATEADAFFGSWREHAAVKAARSLRETRAVSFDAVMSLAVHVDGVDSLGERIPFDARPARLDERWRVEEARDFLAKSRQFVKDTRFGEFLEAHRGHYATVSSRLERRLGERAYLEWFDSFFGAKPRATYRVVAGLLTGRSCFGVGVRFPDGREEIAPVLGVWRFDAQGLPEFTDEISTTVVHEICHSYTNVLVDRFADRLLESGERLFKPSAEMLVPQAYTDGKILLYESLVRACEVRYRTSADGPVAAERLAEDHLALGFEWTRELADLLRQYEADRANYPTLEAFMPRVATFFDVTSREFVARVERAPKVVEILPANGAGDVDPNLAALRITFDQPMMDRSWSICRGEPEFPKLSGEPSYDAARKSLTVPVDLEPGRTYRFLLNGGKFRGFKSERGDALRQVSVRFTTRRE